MSATGKLSCAVRCRAVMSAPSCRFSTYCNSSMNRTSTVRRARAASPATFGDVLVAHLHRAHESCERPPSFLCQTRGGCTATHADQRGVEGPGERAAGRDRSSGASINTHSYPRSSASRSIRFRRTVFPTPRRPTMRRPFEASPLGQPVAQPGKGDFRVLDQCVTPSEFGSGRAGSGRVWVRSSVHVWESYAGLSRSTTIRCDREHRSILLARPISAAPELVLARRRGDEAARRLLPTPEIGVPDRPELVVFPPVGPVFGVGQPVAHPE